MSVLTTKARLSGRKRRDLIWFYIFIAPWLLGFILVSLIPLIGGFIISLSDYDGYSLDNTKFVGLDNYARAFKDSDALFAIGRTLFFTAFSVPLNILVAFTIALLLNNSIKGRGIFRTIFYLPSVLPIVAVTWVWKVLMDNNYGLVNALLDLISPNIYIRWLTDYPTQVLMMLAAWVGTGGAMIIFLAGLQGVPKELEEAAVLDGANYFQKLLAVVIPLLSPVLFYQLVVSIIFSLQILVEPVLLGTGTGNVSLLQTPPRDNYMYMVHTFSQMFANQRFGYGSALLWLLFALILVLTLLIFWLGRFWVFSENERN